MGARERKAYLRHRTRTCLLSTLYELVTDRVAHVGSRTRANQDSSVGFERSRFHEKITISRVTLRQNSVVENDRGRRAWSALSTNGSKAEPIRRSILIQCPVCEHVK